MRGKVVHGRYRHSTRGITPAYAGKRVCIHAHRVWFWDHPRVCGEKRPLEIGTECAVGSPPRMRGKVLKAYDENTAEGITPAYAGKS